MGWGLRVWGVAGLGFGVYGLLLWDTVRTKGFRHYPGVLVELGVEMDCIDTHPSGEGVNQQPTPDLQS